jgi:hypothetical protein
VELSCWIGHFRDAWPTGRDAEDCIDAHINCGIRHLVWELGRSVLTYHSDLPDATCCGLRRGPEEKTAQARAIEAMYRDRCQLRVPLGYAGHRGLTVYGRLCMNRHYCPGTPHRSDFAQNHPQWCEIGKNGWLDPSRLCYAIPEYRGERTAILCEAARIGCDGLCLDFCRQPPAVRYHPAFVGPYRQKTGRDACKLSLADREPYLDWCRFRAESVTQLLRELRDALDPFRQRYGRSVPVQARIPNDGFEANLIAGLDVVRWCEEGLIAELALSEIHWLEEYRDWSDVPYIELGRRTGVAVYAGSNCLPVQGREWSCEVNPRGVDPWVLAQRALRSLEAGAQGISLYQSDTGVRWPGMPDALRAMTSPASFRAFVHDPEIAARHPVTDENRSFGIDNHSDSENFRAMAGEQARGA